MFKEIRSQNKPISTATWNVMLLSLGQHGFGKATIELFDEMQQSGAKPDDLTFMGILNACSHAKLPQEAKHFLEEMQSIFNITPTVEHYTCVVDALGRSGLLQEAADLINRIPKPNIITWMSLLAAALWHKDLKYGEYAVEQALLLDPFHPSVFLLQANLYADLGLWEKHHEVLRKMEELGIDRTSGGGTSPKGYRRFLYSVHIQCATLFQALN
jgi:pentatricopeptide repeat protein